MALYDVNAGVTGRDLPVRFGFVLRPVVSNVSRSKRRMSPNGVTLKTAGQRRNKKGPTGYAGPWSQLNFSRSCGPYIARFVRD